jgi:hypothetical protein
MNPALLVPAMALSLLCGCGRSPPAPSSPPPPKETAAAPAARPAPAASPEDPAQKRRDAVARGLGETDPALVGEVATILEGLVWAQYGEEPSPEYLARIRSVVAKARSQQELGNAEVAALSAQARARTEAEGTRRAREKAEGLERPAPADAFDLAVSRLRAARPALGDYEARQRVAAALHGAWPRAAGFWSRPLPCLVPPEGAPPPPEVDAAYQHFLSIKGDYWTDPAYEKLAAMPGDQVPEGAMLPLLCLLRAPDEMLRRGEVPGVPVKDVLAKCGPRLYPALLAYLCAPPKYNHADGGIPSPLLRHAAGLSADQKQALLRAALRSGWNDALRHLPPEPWTAAALAEFKDSPFGPPNAAGN